VMTKGFLKQLLDEAVGSAICAKGSQGKLRRGNPLPQGLRRVQV
jgi:hypothetical protein